jgi:DNA-directed RNA polymerase specialized sigma24 family protein
VEPGQLGLSALAAACREETNKFLRRETFTDSFCFELFRRAICDQVQPAWETILSQYRGMVLAWVRRHPAATATDEEDDYWVNRTFERFWRAVGPERFGSFRGVADLLTYLKTCAHSVLLDEVRARKAAQVEPLPESGEEGDDPPDARAVALGGLVGRELWAAILREVQDEAERTVTYLSFALDLKPQEIQERHPALYPAVADVYRIKRNVIDRLRRSAAIRDFLG